MKKILPLTVVFLALTFGFILTGCNADSHDNRPQVVVTFDLNYNESEDPKNVTSYKGEAVGVKWPAKPSRLGYIFLGWFKEDTQYNNDTEINSSITLKAKWDTVNSAVATPPSNEIAGLFDPANQESGFPSQLSDARKIWGMRNPLITFAYLADPVPMVFCHANPPCIKNSGDTENSHCDQCVLYMYGSNDTLVFKSDGTPENDNFSSVIQGLRIISTKDLVNWTDHGPQNFTAKESTHPLFPTPAEKVVSYANDTWAPTAEWKMINGKPKFFLYWCNSGNDTSVVVSDHSPLGPWYNPNLVKSMINRDMPNANSAWLFDPGTMIDKDGSACMVLGGGISGTAYDNTGMAKRVKLAENMYSIIGDVQTFHVPYLFEAMDLWKWKGIYYLNYTANWNVGSNPYGLNNIDIAYMMNRRGPMGAFPTDSNVSGSPKKLLPNGSYGDNTNHASLFDYKGQPYITYHASSATRAYGGPRLRVAHLEKIDIENDGSLKEIRMGVQGVNQIGDFNPYKRQEAETMAIGGGIYTKHDDTASNSISAASIDTGDWLGLYGVNFDLKAGGAEKFNAVVKIPAASGNTPYTGAIEIRINPQQEGISNPSDSTILSTSQRSRITGGEVVGRILLKAASGDEDKWILATADMDRKITGKHHLVFVFYSSAGARPERHNAAPAKTTDGRQFNDGFEFDGWWFE